MMTKIHAAILPLLLALLANPAGAASANATPSGIEGTWDLFWQTRKGPSQSGYIVFRMNGEKLIAELHGRGAVRASGSLAGNSFTVRGTRMLVGYRITGTWTGDVMEGDFHVMSIDKHFTGKRRPAPSS